jgi:hypothetical protein
VIFDSGSFCHVQSKITKHKQCITRMAIVFEPIITPFATNVISYLIPLAIAIILIYWVFKD